MSDLKRLRAQGDGIAVLSSVLHLAGWELRDIDLDLISGRARVEVHRYDGRRVILSTDALGRTSLERSHRTIALGRHSSTRGRIPLSPQIEDEFLGRQRCGGPRSGLRALCAYIAANPAPGRRELPPSAVRAAFAPLMGAPARAIAPAGERRPPMGVAHENRVKMMYHREAQERIDHAIEMEALRRGPSNRAPIPAQPTIPSKSEVRRWMRLHAEEYEGATALAEGCNAALDLPQSWLDDPDHWVWDLAAEEGQRAAREVKGMGA